MKYSNEFLGFPQYQYQPLMGWLFLAVVILLFASWLLVRNI